MNVVIKELEGRKIAVVESGEVIIADLQAALDFMVWMKKEIRCDRVAVNKESLTEEFFQLETGLAGEILQKFVGYGLKFAVYGDYSGYGSKSLQAFFIESNRGNDVFFVGTADEAAEKLAKAAGNGLLEQLGIRL